jgi:cytochrome c biogenesis protein CcdA
MVRWLFCQRTLLLVAGVAHLGLRAFVAYSILSRVHLVARRTHYVPGLVLTAFPEHALGVIRKRSFNYAPIGEV